MIPAKTNEQWSGAIVLHFCLTTYFGRGTTFFRWRIIQKICSHPRHDVTEILQCWRKTPINLVFLLKNRWLLVMLNIYFLFFYRELSNNELSWTIEDMNGTFKELKNLQSLSLENNKIKSIAKNAFSGLNKVKTLNLLNNAISSIQSNALETMIEMESL